MQCYINWPNFITKLCLLLSSHSVKCVSCFMLGHLMMSSHLNIWEVLSFKHKKQTSKNVADTTFKNIWENHGESASASNFGYLCQLTLTCLKFNKNTRKRCELCSKLTIKKPKQHQWCCSSISIVSFEHILYLCLVFLLLTITTGKSYLGLDWCKMVKIKVNRLA